MLDPKITVEHDPHVSFMRDDSKSTAALPNNLWPTTRAAVGAIDGLHRLTGLPWWATLTLTAVGVRAALLPLTIRQMRASAAFWSMWRQAQSQAQQRGQAAATRWPADPSGVSMQPSAAAGAASQAGLGGAPQGRSVQPHLPPLAAAAAAQSTAQQHHAAQTDGTDSETTDGQAGARGGPAAAGPGSLRDALAELHILRRPHNLPHPAWILAAPLMQVSVFGTSVLAARAMAAARWPGFATEGTLWFLDLTQAAVVIHWGQDALATTAAFPYGQLGAAMPIAVALALFANVNLSFGRMPPAAASSSGQGAVLAWLLGLMRGAMEWATVPVLALAMALPHGALVYWLSSSLCSLAQSTALGLPAVRQLLALPAGGGQPERTGAARKDRPEETASAPAFDARSTTDVPRLFVKAAELRARSEPEQALRCIERIVELQPGSARARFAAGQLHAGLRAWAAAEQAYLAAAELERQDAAQQTRCWLGAGVAQHELGDLDAALQCFERAGEQAMAALQEGEVAQPPLEGTDTERARRTAVRALMSQASIHKRLGRPDQAVAAARQAAQLDPAAQKHVSKLEADAWVADG